ncbi:hypothetical protein [Amycolatopsis suaedae]|uniref:Aminoglycoside phosphotransferase domain-containing protein n=1 Tax=Amycolatopsis suaedae TaxID=2510978 RepID=A0A4Q7J7X0_9PSEU|nr:hypothetical protein [Amycolatopsis suaedae]RZQ62986.1 hypothetical protein EWH70_14920 [Amycolatopsis suaedae]
MTTDTLRAVLRRGERVVEHDSGSRQVRVVRTGARRYLWCLSSEQGHLEGCPPGPLPEPMQAPAIVDGEAVYTAYGASSLASMLLDREHDSVAKAADTLAAVVPAVLALHRLPADSGLPPPGALRLLNWLVTPPVPGSALARLRETASGSWGITGMEELSGWCRQLLEPARPVGVHGEFSLANIVVGEGNEPAVLLARPVLHRAAAELDLGWLLGELTELEIVERDPVRRHAVRTLRSGVMRYGTAGLSTGLLAKAVVLRIAAHAGDFAAYVGWHPSLAGYVELIRRLAEAAVTDHPEGGSS